ncbi:hypothetical protein B0H17DRAFT_1286336 [Mycena rosella]|uniref:Uncharacterized protein n=1 Tax=Mycena rosella TaxID=1033263 RepID=A0AAD7DI34_MYCRO|nr:hypothetical protein B0H17DRAFT_1286336 [Mycena rosella]
MLNIKSLVFVAVVCLVAATQVSALLPDFLARDGTSTVLLLWCHGGAGFETTRSGEGTSTAGDSMGLRSWSGSGAALGLRRSPPSLSATERPLETPKRNTITPLPRRSMFEASAMLAFSPTSWILSHAHPASCQRPQPPTSNAHPYSPTESKPKNPHGKRPTSSSVLQSPASPTSNSTPRKSHDSSWSTEGTYTRTQRPAQRPRGLSQPTPLRPLRVPISHPYQQRSASWVDLTEDDGPNIILPPARSTSRPRMTPYERDGDPLSLRRSAFVPYEADRARARKEASWRVKIQHVLDQWRFRRAIKRLRRLMCVIVWQLFWSGV